MDTDLQILAQAANNMRTHGEQMRESIQSLENENMSLQNSLTNVTQGDIESMQNTFTKCEERSAAVQVPQDIQHN